MVITNGSQAIDLLAAELSKPENQSIHAPVVISKLYEKMSGKELFRETDPENGEDYEYKHDPDSCVTSFSLHKEVTDFFFLKQGRLIVDGRSLFFNKKADKIQTNQLLAKSMVENKNNIAR
jgi:hypothetical protein